MKGKIFNAQEVQAILNGSKVMFREVVKPQPNANIAYRSQHKKTPNVFCFENKFGGFQTAKCPYQVGQKIFCKESWFESGTWGQTHPEDDEYKVWHPRGYQQKSHIHYAANGLPSIRGENSWNLEKPYCDSFIPDQDSYFWRKRSPLHMPQWASRLTLQIKSVGVERLDEISEEDAIAEGCSLENNYDDLGRKIEELAFQNALIDGSASKTIFAKLWNATHKKPEEKFEASPWVWKVQMEVVK